MVISKLVRRPRRRTDGLHFIKRLVPSHRTSIIRWQMFERRHLGWWLLRRRSSRRMFLLTQKRMSGGIVDDLGRIRSGLIGLLLIPRMIVAQGSHQRQVHVLSPYIVFQLCQIEFTRRMNFLTTFAIMTGRGVLTDSVLRFSRLNSRIVGRRRCRDVLRRRQGRIRKSSIRIVQRRRQLSFQLQLLFPQFASRILYDLLLESSIIFVF